jgi:hypothetical protein
LPEVRESRGAGEVRKSAVGGGERRREKRDGANLWARRQVAATSAKPSCKTVGGTKVNDFKSSMAKDFWFCGLMAKTKLRL